MHDYSATQNGSTLLPHSLLLLLRTRLAQAFDRAVLCPISYLLDTSLLNPIWDRLFGQSFRRQLAQDPLKLSITVMVAICCTIGTGALGHWLWTNKKPRKLSDSSTESILKPSDDEASATDPALLKKHSSIRSYTVPATGFTYPEIRTFYRRHGQQDKLPNKPRPIPLLVFIHGLGGSAAQFNSILTSLVNVASCLAIDLPGCGLSSFKPTDWKAYTSEALVYLLVEAIEAHRDVAAGQGVVLVSHSMGCSLATLLASTTSPYGHLLNDHILGVVDVCPKIGPLNDKERKGIKTITNIPGPIFDLMRKYDRRGGINSHSVLRMTGPQADKETRKMQLRFNKQSRTAVWRRMSLGIADTFPGEDIWTGLRVPVFLFGAEDDHVTPALNVEKIHQILSPDESEKLESKSIKTYIFPSPASHSMLFSPTSARSIAGFIGTFLSEHVDSRLSLGWQLQHLATEGKWDVKNLNKWKSVRAVSAPIASTFRAMKTLREVDDIHTPKQFVKEWAGRIYAVVDISYDVPVYDSQGLEDGGIRYFKCPTISKYPPEREEVETFCSLIDRIRAEKDAEKSDALIAVHCHYGFNRTGFLLVCYLVKRLGYNVQEAIDTFASSRPNGIKHSHFIDELYVRANEGTI
ncbi:hypothetical protein BU24DRAFT_460989 [Aaosphaeria arxii CBS 175.79]|uniref:Tyrosine specific protein phosphatases domain-containing protein n=1 Tax=Aaosphaeria arxii CBS 175.79 TaxID=1450172 RepID=A0A6A5XYH6_9PLEO|nr:uncharacterized protein BU24DRAFT_460989 [Aaosphaeria arxii CBS 175.79]KAF2018009.1 hypothetical protein BU24DRAFT_460989 [Aaosphaeria arxii CBS 175.79]